MDMMTPSQATPGFPLPAVAKALAPFLHTRADILLIRRQLANLVSQQQQQQPSLTSIRAETHLTGIRKRYLQAVKERQAVLAEWQSLSSESGTTPGPEQETPESWTQVYNQVLDLRRRYSTLAILKDHLSTLYTDEQTSLSSWSSITNISLPPAPTTLPHTLDSTTDDLLLPLEKAVTAAAAELEHERQLYNNIKDKGPGENTLYALHVTKVELERWLDEQLTLAGDGFEPRTKSEDIPISIDEQIKEITAVYNDYVFTRQALVDAASQSSSISFQPTAPSQADSAPAPAPAPASEPPISALLPHLSKLLDIHHRSRNLHALTLALTSTTTSSSALLDASLERLRSESRLLDFYPSRAATHGGVKAWEFAASEGRRAMMEDVKMYVDAAQKTLERVDVKIDEVGKLVDGKRIWSELE